MNSGRDCGSYSRRGQPLDSCRGSRAALRRVEYPGQGGGETRAALRRVGFSAQELDSCSVRWRSGFPRIAWSLVLCSGCWVHDGFQMLSGLSDAPTLTTRCRCRAATDHHLNNAHLVLQSIWNGELSSGKREPNRTRTQSTIGEDAMTLLVMDCQCQDEFVRCADPGSEQERINVTFRWVRQHVAPCLFLTTGVAGCLPTCAQGSSASVAELVGNCVFFRVIWVLLGALSMWRVLSLRVYLLMCTGLGLRSCAYRWTRSSGGGRWEHHLRGLLGVHWFARKYALQFFWK